MAEVNCACVIHSNKYSWEYVDNLYNQIVSMTDSQINFHVFTEKSRAVPAPYIKHELEEWEGINGPRKSWWYKMQLFNPAHQLGRVLYLDLDTVIIGNLDWIWALDPRYFWTIRDFRYLWRPNWTGINSSIMLWNTRQFEYVWRDFAGQNINTLARQYHGDQDYLSAVLDQQQVQFIDREWVHSWRWQIKDGGMDMGTRLYRRPGQGSQLLPTTKIIVFHGDPKPHEVADPIIQQHWRLKIYK